MLSKHKLTVLLALVLFTVPASASPIVYVVNLGQQFGTVDTATGSFHQIGPNTPEGSSGLVAGPNGSLLTLTFAGNLNSIDPATGVTTAIGPTGLADCTAPPVSPCGPTSANTLGNVGGTIYATDLSNNLYTVNPGTGATTLIGNTGIPAVPFMPTTMNPDGSINIFDETLFSAGGKLYATFDAGTLDLSSSTITAVIPGSLYQIDPSTGMAKLIAPTTLNLSAVANVNGTIYTFNGGTGEILTLDLATGVTTFVSNADPAVGLVGGASATPEPTSIALAGVGIGAIVLHRWRKR